ncbi:hypothetical protein BGZ99_005897 [Dissophora globulifera]|uniref:Uncharacterized protein n=1 Tax=Dissophora globulifera TaxID=979702 RepID=A0A9P6RFV4_9FUNG|nr:hypothetical protein BGZ99_005897 [Dissophora globulifera]
MPKRSLSLRAQKAQKLLRPNNGGAPTVIGSQVKDSDDTSPIENTNVDDQDALLTTKLACAIFGDSPLTRESSAVGYLVSLKSQAILTPAFDEYLTYMQRVSPGTTLRNADRAWTRMKQFFSDDNADFSTFENLIDLVSLATVFKEISAFTTSSSALSSTTAMPPPPQLPRSPQTPSSPAASSSSSSPPALSAPLDWPRSNSVSISGSNGSGSTSGSSSNSRGKVAPGQILTMKNLFNANFDKFDGGGWSLPSGAVVDDRLRRVVEALPYESALHSFIVEDIDTVLRLFDDAKDREEITNTMLSFLQRYNRPPKGLHEFLLNHGCGSVGDAFEEKLSEEFRIVVHDCITQVLRNYQRYGYAFPQEPSEAWFNHHLWGFLPFALSCYPLFDYKPGEISSESSAHRRRKQHSWDTQQYMGHKVDGVVVISKRPVEICWMEAVKKDGRVNTSKCLHDTKNLMKLMKDGHDMIREKAEQDIRYQLATFALRISGPSISIFTLRQRQGRFYQAAEEETISLPLTWLDKEDTTQVLAVIARILKLRKAIQVMAASISTWTQSTIGDESSGVKDWIAPTITSPQLLPVAPTIYATNAPLLDI